MPLPASRLLHALCSVLLVACNHLASDDAPAFDPVEAVERVHDVHQLVEYRPIVEVEIDHAAVPLIERARELLGWRPRRSDVDTLLADAWAWHRDHPAGYASG